MFTLKKIGLLKSLLAGIALVLGLGFGTTIAGNTMAMSSHGSTPLLCQADCNPALPTKKEDLLKQVERDEKEPQPAVCFTATVVLALLALPFAVKDIFRLNSWRPPDYVRLYAAYLS